MKNLRAQQFTSVIFLKNTSFKFNLLCSNHVQTFPYVSFSFRAWVMDVRHWGMEHLVDLDLVNLDHGTLAHAEVGVLVHLRWAVVLMATLDRLAEDHHFFHCVTEFLMIQPMRRDHPFQLLRETIMMELVKMATEQLIADS